jgi:Cu-Zn family superoxide dismutase
MRRRPAALCVLALAGLGLVACGDDGGDKAAPTTSTTAGPMAVADLAGPDGRPLGRVTFAESGGKIVVEGRLTDLPPGFHGFHVHAVGKCEPGPSGPGSGVAGTSAFTSAGGHMTVGTQAHPAHAGDQPVLLVLTDRTSEIRFTTDRYTLADLLNSEGRAVIVHANPDNYGNIPTRYARTVDTMTQATGDAGDRIACGVVKRP